MEKDQPANGSPGDAELFEGLRILNQAAFPKMCACCGRVYRSLEEYLALTSPVTRGTGLKESVDDDDRPMVEVYRNCACGSTAMEYCADRRDNTEFGQERRQRFEALVETLVARGYSPETARAELKKILRGEPSELLATRPPR